ncbi:uncharacterized protein LOC143714806 [Siphateles boraxobius]|uniref:uncharacterized protein LOC143714806 n=1 Tax=Siphateles boraxobius TaxID=180520 RepID=UPI0040635615
MYYQDQTSQHVTSTSEPELLSVAEEPGHAEVDDEWSDDAFQDLVGDSSEWGADVLNSLSCVFSDFNVNTLQTPVCVATDLSVDVLQATVCATSDYRVPVRDVAYYRANVSRVPVRDVAYYRANVHQVPVRDVAYCGANVPQVPVRDVAYYRANVPQVPVRGVAYCGANVPQVPVRGVAYYRANVPRVPVLPDCSVDVPQVPVSTTSAPDLDVADCCIDVPQVPVCAILDCRDDFPQVPVCAISDCKDDVPQVPVCAISHCRDDVPQVTVCATSDCLVNVPHVGPTGDTVSPQLKQLEDNEIINVGSCSYEIGRKLGEGGFGSIYAGIRLRDGLKVALKFADNAGIDWIDIEGNPEPVPQEIGLLMLANKGHRVPQIIQLLDWVEEPERYIMVLEWPTPCENLIEFLDRYKGTIEEDVALVIMQQATLAAQTCCHRGVLHRDIKLENLLINPYTLEVKLIDFGCGEILTNAGYTSFAGTKPYCPPEYDLNGEYHGEPATVWSLGILLFALLCGQFPESEDLDELNDNIWIQDGLSQECCKLLCSLLQRNPEKRLELDNVCLHNWFKYFNCQPEDNEIIDVGFCSYEIGRKLGGGGFGSVYAGTRLKDGLEVVLKFADNVGIEWIDIEGNPEPVPQEIGLLLLANKGHRVSQIIQLLDWDEEPDRYIMVLEWPTPCESLIEFLGRHKGTIEEDVASVIMQQATLAAQTCCHRGVLHRDIKLENLLINPYTLEVKLIDFGCSKILTNTGYTSFPGTKPYCPPEYDLNGEYHGEPATVWSLGILLFALLCGQFPESEDLDELNYNLWIQDGLSQECCELLSSLLQRKPEKRLELDNVCLHNWFKYFNCQPEDNEIIDVGFCSYEIGRKLGGGGFGSVYAGTRLKDGLEVALKFADNVGIDWIDIEGNPEPVPQEIGLLMLANKGHRVPQIIQLLDWDEEPERYIMVLEWPTPCESLIEFLGRHKGTIEEDVASVIMQQATLAAQTCCHRGVLHRDIKLKNLLINPFTLEVKLIDFGCSEILTNAGYTSFPGTKPYCPPEYDLNGEYHGEPATVWSLGILLFALLCGQFPESDDLDELNDNFWTKDGLSQECCELLCSLLQRKPEKRLELDNVCLHNWFKYFNCQPEDNEIIDVGFCSYEIGRKLGGGGFGSVYAGTRLKDGLEVALKFADNVGIEWIDIEGNPEPVPQEIGLLMLANKGHRVPQIIQLLDWDEEPERYIMVLEWPTPCESLIEFLGRHKGTIEEDIASVIMQQATLAAQTCCYRGVLHRDIKLKNLLINPYTLEVKLIDFGCSEILTNAGYMSFPGTKPYCPPEYDLNGEYHGEPATVWSLGILLFALLCGQFPESEDLDELNYNIWTKDGLSQECCELLCSLLQRKPEKRLELDNVCLHNWFKYFNCQPEDNEIIDVGFCSYEIGRKLGGGGFGSVYAGTRLKDGLEVALKFADNVGIDWIDIEGNPEPVPQEIGLLMLANKGHRVPQIIQLLDWDEEPERYIMVLEWPTPCESLIEFLGRHKGTIEEDIASVIMQQATLAAQTCCHRGVLHRDIKLKNLLINPYTLEVKLIDFGCSEILTNTGYTSFPGTKPYCPPEYDLNGEYHGEPATVWSLGILLFALLCGQFPESEDSDELNDNFWTKDGLSQECCELLCSLLQRKPEKRLELDNVCLHNWFK